MQTFIPIPPVQSPTGSLVALHNLMAEESAQPIDLTQNDDPFANLDIFHQSLNISLAMKLGLGSIFDASTSLADKAFYLDALCFTDKYRETPVSTGVAATRWGVGLRVLLKVQDYQGTASLNFGLVGAAVELNMAQAVYQILGYGLGIKGFAFILGELNGLGKFDQETYSKLTGEVFAKFKDFVLKNKDELKPQPIAVALVNPVDTLTTAQATYLAIKAISNRWPISEAFPRMSLLIDRSTVRRVYAEFANVKDDNERPSEDAERRAEAWLNG